MARKPELGKFLLWAHFRRCPEVAKYLPETSRYTQTSLQKYLAKYRMIYVKPSGGSMGRGVMKVWRQNGRIHVHKTVAATQSFPDAASAIRFIDQQREGKPYIVQQGIQLATWNGRPFDIRVMVQRLAPGGAWLYSGMLAKVAGKGSVVTNVALSRGAVIPVERALKEGLGQSKEKIAAMTEEMKKLSLTAAKHFDTYQFYREIGFDIAVDIKGRLWMIEQNTAPSHPLFRKFTDDPSMYRRIQFRWGQYQRAVQNRNKFKK